MKELLSDESTMQIPLAMEYAMKLRNKIKEVIPDISEGDIAYHTV